MNKKYLKQNVYYSVFNIEMNVFRVGPFNWYRWGKHNIYSFQTSNFPMKFLTEIFDSCLFNLEKAKQKKEQLTVLVWFLQFRESS